MNIRRILLGGIAAGGIINGLEFLANLLWFQEDWMRALHGAPLTVTQGIGLIVWGFLIGMLMSWLYAALTARFGSGTKTAVIAAVFLWIPGYALANALPALLGLVSSRLMAELSVVGLVEFILGGIVAARVVDSGQGN